MKYIKKFEMWTTDVTDKNIVVNYNDKKQKLSDVVIDTIKFIEDNYDDINKDINDTNESAVGFFRGLKFNKISLYTENRKDYKFRSIWFNYYDINNNNCGYMIDITEDDYDYLKNYFYNLYNTIRKEDQEKNKEEHKSALQKIEDKKVKDDAKKYNL